MSDFTVVNSEKLAELKRLNVEKNQLTSMESTFGILPYQAQRLDEIKREINNLIETI